MPLKNLILGTILAFCTALTASVLAYEADAILSYEKDELVLGSPSAPLQVRKIFSLTCMHCAKASVDVVAPLIASEMFKEGKVMLILDPFPLDPIAAAEQQLLSCAPSSQRSLALMKIMYKEQKNIAKSSKALDYLRKLMGAWGMNREAFDSCVTNTASSDCSFADVKKRRDYNRCIMNGFRNAYSKWVKRNEEVERRFAPAGFRSATPTFFLNGELIHIREWKALRKKLLNELDKIE